MNDESKATPRKKINRKDFLIGTGLVASGIFFGEMVGRSYRNTIDPGITMGDKLEKYCMVIDLNKCIGCDACTIACKQENHTPPGVQYNIVIKEDKGSYPNSYQSLLPKPCMHCEKPPCVKVCPVGATWKRQDGIVVIDYEKCIGCRYCITACPYGARYFDFGENYYDPPNSFENSPSYEYNKEWVRKKNRSPINNVRKCHYCLHRIEKGLKPACVDTCTGRARYFGDLNNIEDEVTRLVSKGKTFRFKEELGTKPLTRYIAKG